MMKENALQEVSVEQILLHYNLIVPEIQREYVWGYNTHNIIDVFLNDIVEGKATKDTEMQSKKENLQIMIDSPDIPTEAKEALKIAVEQLGDVSLEMNIGFLYSYRPGYSTGSKDRDLYLIDGQQRFTTLFLILFYFAIKEGKESDFVKLFNINISIGSLGFDYRVRNLTHHFFVELFTHTKTIEDLLDIRNKIWFLNNFSLDVTIRSIVGNEERKSIFEIFEEKFKNSTEKYFDYIKSKVMFWHFKTEETSQGEELYITMNSRGQQLADNESIRAKLFDSDIVRANPLYWSEQWENWQDFFWKNRSKARGFSADEGFNEFLRWVQLLKMIEKQIFTPDDNFEKQIHYLQNNKKELDTIYLDLKEIKLYYESLLYIKNFFRNDNIGKTLQPFEKYSKAFKFSINDFINGSFLNQNQLFIILPLLEYCKKYIESKSQLDDLAFLRVFKFVTNLSSDVTIGKSIRDQILNIIQHISMLEIGEDITGLLNKNNVSKTIINDEQRTKLSIYKEASTEERLKIEDSFWYCETLEYVRGEISHLIKLSLKIDSVFKHNIFDKILDAYNLFLKNKNILKGELIKTDVYYYDRDKFVRYYDFTRKNGFLELIENLYEIIDVRNFVEKSQKHWFLRNYNSEENLVNESNRKNQLYVIYILKHNTLAGMGKWEWSNDRLNFGVWSSYGNCSSIFKDGVIFQLIKTNFVENSNYIFDFHYKKLNSEKVFNALQNWSENETL